MRTDESIGGVGLGIGGGGGCEALRVWDCQVLLRAFVSDWLREAYVTSCALIETLRTSHVLRLSASYLTVLYLTNLAETYRIPK